MTTILRYIKLLYITGAILFCALIFNKAIKAINVNAEVVKHPTNVLSNTLINDDVGGFTTHLLLTEANTKENLEEILKTSVDIVHKEIEEKERQAKQKEEEKRKEEDRLNSLNWQTGIASAYGGSTDKAVASNAKTATGQVVDETSMGVAIPISWNRADLYGSKVLIKYKGQTVEATINDCGGMGGGSRSLDLQPGVFKAFGFNSCQAWGLRTVEYKIL